MLLIYEIAIQLFSLAIRIAARFNHKAALWVEGRKQALPVLPRGKAGVMWLHAASLGEFEQGRPIVEAFREQYPDWTIVLSFFSPSGYEIRKNYPLADVVCYLPADTRRNARAFLDAVQPDLAVFVKYEFWANYLFELQRRGTPTLLVSALFRPSQPFFKWYGGFWRKMLGCYAHIFVQNEASGNLLQNIGIQNVSIAGDTRVDRVINIAEQAPENAIVQAFVADKPGQVIIFGSSWDEDEALAERLGLAENGRYKLIIAPHEPSEARVAKLSERFPHSIRYSHWPEASVTGNSIPSPSTLIMDNIGLLNTLYRYGTIAIIGGGFGKGIHNTLEPAAFGLPIIFGPAYEKFEEARQLVARGGAFPVRNADELQDILTRLEDPVFYQNAARAVLGYLEESCGATGVVMKCLRGLMGG